MPSLIDEYLGGEPKQVPPTQVGESLIDQYLGVVEEPVEPEPLPDPRKDIGVARTDADTSLVSDATERGRSQIIPTPVAERNIDTLRRRDEDLDVTAFMDINPAMSAWLAENPDNTPLAKKDWQQLSIYEAATRVFKPVPALAWSNVIEAGAGAIGLLGFDERAEEWRHQVDLVRKQVQLEDPVERGSWAESTRNAFVSIYTQAPAYGVGLLLRGATVPLTMMGIQAGLQKSSELLEAGVTRGVALSGGTVSGVSEALTELIPAKAFLDIMRFNKGVGKNLLRHLIGDQLGEQVNLGVDIAVDKVAIGKDTTWDEYFENVIATAKTTAIQSGFMGATAGTFRNIVDRGEAKAPPVQSTKQFLEQMGEVAKNTDMRSLSPTKYKEAMSRVAEGHPLKDLYMPTDAWINYWRDNNIDPVNMMRRLDGEEVEGFVKVPLESYLSDIAPTEHNAFFSEEAKNAPQAMNAKEFQVFNETIKTLMPQEMREQVETDIEDSIRNGMDEETATLLAYEALKETPEGQEVLANAQRVAEVVPEAVRREATPDEIIKAMEEALPEEAIPDLEEMFERITQEDLTEEEILRMAEEIPDVGRIIEEVAVVATEQQLIDAGLTPEQARSSAAVMSGFEVLARRSGIPVEDLLERYLPEITRIEGEAVRGKIDFRGLIPKIELFEKADLSTFLHETGHLYFRMIQDLSQIENASQSLKDDFQSIKKWLGWKEGQKKFTKAQNEKFARGFEAYLREGKAPNNRLKEAFDNFSQWLTDVYRSFTDLGVDLTPEVTEVFDRLLAEEDVIAKEGVLPEGLVAEVFEQAPIEPPKIVKPAKEKVKTRVRRVTRQVKDKELKSLREDFVRAARTAREAFRAGKIEGTVKEAQKLKRVLARARKIRVVRDYFNLSDNDLKKISRKNPLLLSQYEFKLYLDEIREKAAQLSDEHLQKAALIQMIWEKDLKRVDNYRKALEMPPISKMNVNQIQKFAELLEPFHEGDVFLSERELQTVDRTDLEGIRTWREAKERLAKEIGVSMEDLEKIKVKEWDEYKWDTSLAETNPFYRMLVTETSRKLLEANTRIHEIENKVFELARKSEKSRGRTLTERAIPQDKQILEYIEAPADMKDFLASKMTPEQLDYAHFIQNYFQGALEYLIKTKGLERGRENYFVHVRRGFLETVKDEGLLRAFRDIFRHYVEDEASFNILDDDTGNILPLEKFFQFTLRRTGGMVPTANVTRAFLQYATAFEKKVSLDELIPKMDIYAQSITPEIYTPLGLERDRSLKKFVNKYINNKKGRKIRWIAKQGGTIDIALRGLKVFTTTMDLGLNVPSGVAAFVGEQVANFQMLGTRAYAKGSARMRTKKGKDFLKKYEAFTGRSAWENFTAPSKDISGRLADMVFGLFHQSTVTANKQFLLGVITDKEYNSGEISLERLAEIKVEMGRFRVVPDAKSMVGATSAGSAFTQYRTWAIPIMRTNLKNINTLMKDLATRDRKAEAFTTKEAREIYRAISLISMLIVVGAFAFSEEEDESFTGQMLAKLYREALTLVGAMDPTLLSAPPRILVFLGRVAANIKSIILLEEYKTKEGLKGVDGLQRQIVPRAVKQFIPKEED